MAGSRRSAQTKQTRLAPGPDKRAARNAWRNPRGGSAERRLAQLPEGHLEHVAALLVNAEHGGRFETAVHHAVLAAGVVAAAELAPVGLFEQLIVRLVVAVGDQITGPLPAADVASRARPGGAFQIALPAQKFQVDRRGCEPEPL